MPFLSLSLNNFRNLKNDKIDLSAKEIFFVGKNGQGKTNLLEALYFVSYGNSFRTHVDSQLIQKGQEFFSLKTLYQRDDKSLHQVSVQYEKNKKKIEKNGKTISDRKALLQTIPCILFCHSDMNFVIGEPEYRRFFLDQSLTLFNTLYLDDLRRYKKVLKNRNIVLKEKKYEMLDAYDLQLVQTGLEIQKKRKQAVFYFNQIFEKKYEEVSGLSNVNILYEPSWKEKENLEEVLSYLKEKRERDKIMETTMSGPHRDKITFVKDGKFFLPEASTGQQRLLALLLRISQAVYYQNVTTTKPILLMDDVLLELDPEKRQKFTALLPEYEQLFCTFLPGEPFEKYQRTTTKVYQIEEGEWHG
ncbi:MAG: DNA replication/repair protein RecF [Treponema sp.]|nr:DNA replication/repair protein RecF [Treponema sp.]